MVYSLSSVDVHFSWYEISASAVLAVLNRDENDELVYRQIQWNIVVSVVVVVVVE